MIELYFGYNYKGKLMVTYTKDKKSLQDAINDNKEYYNKKNLNLDNFFTERFWYIFNHNKELALILLKKYYHNYIVPINIVSTKSEFIHYYNFRPSELNFELGLVNILEHLTFGTKAISWGNDQNSFEGAWYFPSAIKCYELFDEWIYKDQNNIKIKLHPENTNWIKYKGAKINNNESKFKYVNLKNPNYIDFKPPTFDYEIKKFRNI